MDSDRTTIVFTLDLDWVEDGILEWTMDLFKENGFPVTLFATHRTPLLEKADRNVELGIHPNFFDNADHAQHIRDLLSLYPGARGVRSHGLFEYSNLMNLYKECGLLWDSSQLLYLCSNIRPYRHPSGLIRTPIFWEDDDYLSLAPDWKVETLGLRSPGVKCFDFHPIHLRLNTYTPSQYSLVKKEKFSPGAIREAEYKGDGKGILSFFRKLCDYVANNALTVSSMGEVCMRI